MPHLNDLYEEYKDEGLVVLGVCTSNRGQENYGSTVESVNIEYPVALDSELKTIAKDNGWVVNWYPTYVVVDKKGVVRASGLFNDKGTEEIIKKLLAEEAPAEAEGETGADDDGDGATAEVPAELLEGRDDRAALQSELAGKPAPALEVTNWMNVESPLDLADLKGKVVMLDYWATW